MDWRKYGPSPPPLSFAYRQIEISRWVQGLNCLSLSLDIFLHRVILYFTYLAPLLSILLHSVITVESLSRSVSLVWEGRGWPAWHAIGRTWPRWWGSETGRRARRREIWLLPSSCAWNYTPSFRENSQKRSFPMNEYERFGFVFTKTRVCRGLTRAIYILSIEHLRMLHLSGESN